MFLISVFPVYIASDKIIIFIFYKRSAFHPDMKVNGRHFESIWIPPDHQEIVQIIDQRHLPFELVIEDIDTAEAMFTAIRDMHLRGAPLIGAAGALGMYLAVLQAPKDEDISQYIRKMAMFLKSSRPTAINLSWGIERIIEAMQTCNSRADMIFRAREVSLGIMAEEKENCRMIGEHGLVLISELRNRHPDVPVNILTHCNAGWLACIDYGTALAPIYLAYDKGIPLHVWVDETRPRNQGARLTSWELQQHGIPCTVITDNAGGYLMSRGKVDMVLVGSDRASSFGDIVNKVGTYLKALAAFDNKIPFYAAMPSSTIDWELEEGGGDTPIEERDADEIRYVEGWADNRLGRLMIMRGETCVSNYGFDITPARLITAIITERGITKANKKQIMKLFPEKN
jgi:methylthioribose-1-phosphate isomerase